jgi:two-component system KDP operon response regulator KdpE
VTRVLLVDDEPQLLRALGINLRARDYDVHTAATGAEALAVAARVLPDVVVLDLGLPDLDGVDVIHGLRGWTNVPIVVLSARRDLPDKVEALDAGADDYLIKPFAIDELLARLRSAVRRGSAGGVDEPVVETAAFTVDLARSVVTRDGSVVHLTPTEWRMLEVLARNVGRLVGQKQLLQQVWGPAYETETNYLRLYLAKLRRKLEPEPSRPRHLLTEPGLGVRLQP